MTLPRRRFLALAAGAAASSGMSRFAQAQEWPAKTIHAIVPFTAGSATDIIPRTVFNQLSIDIGQPIIVENRTGAGGTLGAAAVARAEPDGYAGGDLVGAHHHPSVYPNAGYDAFTILPASRSAICRTSWWWRPPPASRQSRISSPPPR